ncbi:plasmid partitioning protein RepB [Tateyamaria omphalii]|uniref:Plasmid partitioning protein RepB n=1 Tax=Tateyamaria omphalii TaxID=299262 RepID=A0A1P8N154_9RHOB|nr:plasmid partitioning protein RepB [Tateyamaria omphalii]APX14057.1 plasmid partitioning protein RepB [Tateyamaria omphalii]
MARKDLLKSVIGQPTDTPSGAGRSSYAMRGASKSMKVSIDSLAENSKRLMEGETIVEIDPGLVDVSFVSDRLSGDDDAFDDLKASIAASGQDTPVLLRPHPDTPDRYMVVFGHRRVRVARDLGRPVRAVVKDLDDVGHVLAQGQENTARADLSFIEKAQFAKNLADLGQGREVIQQALTVDASRLSRMLSVAQTVPPVIVQAIGPAKQIGRDRWEEFKKLMADPANEGIAYRIANSDAFRALDSDMRFEMIQTKVAEAGTLPKRKRARTVAPKRTWTAGEGRIKGVVGRSGRAYSISLTAQDAAAFGDYLAENLDQLYADFRKKARGGF